MRAWLPGACSPAEANRGPESALYSGARGMVIAENRIKRSGRPFASFRCRRSASRSRASERATRSGGMRRAGSRIRSRAGRQGVRYVRARWPCVVWFGIISTVPQAYHGRSLGRWQGEYLAGTGDLSLLTNAGSDPSAVSRTLRSLPSSANNRTIRRTPVGIIIATRWRLAAALKQMVWSNAFFVSVRSINKTPTASCAP